VYCQLGYLGVCLPACIRQALDGLPETLDGTYVRTLEEIKDTNWEFARRLFLCVAAASRPLRVEELAEFLAFDFKAGPIPKFREDWRLEDPLEAVLSTCSTLLALVDVDGSSVIQFSHFSVKEFLMSPRFGEKRDTISSRYHVSMTAAHTVLAQGCLGILLHLDENVTRSSLEQFPLAKYAAEHWVEHARFRGVSQNVEDGMKQLFDGNKPHLAVWGWIHQPDFRRRPFERAESPSPSPPDRSPLHLAAFYGLHTVVKSLAIQHPQDVDSRGGDDKSTALHLASIQGYVEAAHILIEYGADATARDRFGSTALHLALQSRRPDAGLARFLVEHGADVTARDRYGRTPLHLVLQSDRPDADLARILVERGADATAQNKYGWTPLHLLLGSARPDADLARFLVERGANATAQDKVRST
jgi:hypothetical protein